MTMPISEIHNCDCIEYMRSLPDNAFDLAIADPPYGGANATEISWVGDSEDGSTDTRDQRTVRPIRCSRTGGTWAARYGGGIRAWDYAPDAEFFKQLYRVSRNQIIWGANYFPDMPPTRCFIVWRKASISERFSMAMAEYAWTSFNGNAKVYERMPQDKRGGRFHPTAKPVELYGWLLDNFARPGQTIFDPMMGSQSSRIAAWLKGFDYYGCEIDKRYFELGCDLFDAQCHGIITRPDGTRVTQPTLFTDNT